MKYFFLLLTIISLYSCSSDNASKNTQALNFSDVFTFEVDTLDLDMISHVGENSLYITYSANGYDENVLKYNLTTLSLSNLAHPDLTESRQIEFIGNSIYSISSNGIYKYDLNLNNLVTVNNIYNGTLYHRAIAYNNDILIPRGVNNILKYNSITNDYSFPFTILNQKPRADGEIFNDILYTFGGNNFTGETLYGSDEINIFDILNDTWTLKHLPFTIYESFTASYNNTIIVGGNKETDSSGAFLGIYNPATNAFDMFTTSLDIDNITIRSITVLNDDLYIAYADLVLPMSIKVVKASLI